MADTEAYFRSLWWTLSLVPNGELFVGMKIRLTPFEVTMRFISSAGYRQVNRIKHEGNHYYEWVEDK